jgi:hypothetical protein
VSGCLSMSGKLLQIGIYVCEKKLFEGYFILISTGWLVDSEAY